MKLAEVKPFDRDSKARELLRERLENPEPLSLVVIIEQHTDGTRRILTSPGSMEEKALLKCFFDHFVLGWFANSVLDGGL